MASSAKPGFLKSLATIVTPPFDGLWLLVVLYYGWCFLVYPHSQTLRGNFPDPDDYMYLAQILDWLKGQGWYDNIQHRLNPPEGTPIHFSRLAMLPMAIPILGIHALGLPYKGAATLVALVYPLVLFSTLLLTLRWVASSFMPKNWTGVTAYTGLFATGMIYMFIPGHVDHHGLIVVLIALTLGLTIRMMDQPADPAWGLWAGLALGLGLTIALEILPWLLLFAAWIGIWATIKGKDAARSGMGFALALYVSSLVFLALTRPWDQLFVPDVLTYSLVYVLMTGGIAVAFAGLVAAAESPAWMRFGVGGFLAALTGFLFLHRFPDLVGGPYGGMDPQLAQMMLGEIDEASPLLKMGKDFLGIVMRIGGTLVAFVAICCFIRRARGTERPGWGLILLLQVSAFLLTMFYQVRFMGVLSLMTVIPMAVLLQRGLGWAKTLGSERRRVLAEIGFILLVGPLPTVLFPALIDGRSFRTGMLLFPVDSSVAVNPCDMYKLEQVLTIPAIYGGRQRLIMSSMGEGPELLFRTNHQVLSAPFHMDVSGNIDATRFFSTPYVSEAEAIARRRHTDLVISCRSVPAIYVRPPANEAPTNANSSHDFAPHFAELLMTDKAPSWLKQIHFRGLENFIIYEVHLSEPIPSPASTPAK